MYNGPVHQVHTFDSGLYTAYLVDSYNMGDKQDFNPLAQGVTPNNKKPVKGGNIKPSEIQSLVPTPENMSHQMEREPAHKLKNVYCTPLQ